MWRSAWTSKVQQEDGAQVLRDLAYYWKKKAQPMPIPAPSQIEPVLDLDPLDEVRGTVSFGLCM